MNNQEFELLLSEKDRVIAGLQNELKNTNHSVMLLTMELEKLKQACLREKIEARKETESQLKKLAYYDPLTALPNRALFIEQLKWALKVAKRNNKLVALMFLDLDRFKLVNDTLGHHAGDLLLIEVARRLEKCVREVDTVSRLAGDEFTVILTNLNTVNETSLVANKVLQSFELPVNLDNREIFISTSIGITTFPADGIEVDKLLKNADTAMYQAKELGRNNYQFFSHAMNQKVLDELEMETNLHNALKNNEFLLHYQPQVDINTHEIVGVEVLIRWKHPVFGFISPTKFIPHAEKTDLILTIGEWVMHSACTQAVQWKKEGIKPIRMAINISGTQLKRQDLLLITAKTLLETGLAPHLLELELTEGVIMENAELTINTLNQLKNMGVRLSIDDFGTGYSSLNYLKRFPIDTLKIDQSFIKDITKDPDDYAIASTIIAMAHNLRLTVIAEGVETKEQLEMLRNKNCNEVQGYYFSKPLPENKLKQLLKCEFRYLS
jgi:diguanylate cyclase (GGDEF)-like protein